MAWTTGGESYGSVISHGLSHRVSVQCVPMIVFCLFFKVRRTKNSFLKEINGDRFYTTSAVSL